mmetsp:Transcript_36989/g.92033  ORF Transcript_36989/g.92033 Transcript_36989/m.92033 type:complete len:91 (-) Transcript_36989:162-434(-)
MQGKLPQNEWCDVYTMHRMRGKYNVRGLCAVRMRCYLVCIEARASLRCALPSTVRGDGWNRPLALRLCLPREDVVDGGSPEFEEDLTIYS